MAVTISDLYQEQLIEEIFEILKEIDELLNED